MVPKIDRNLNNPEIFMLIMAACEETQNFRERKSHSADRDAVKFASKLVNFTRKNKLVF